MSAEHVFVRSSGAQTPPTNRPTHASVKFMPDVHRIYTKKISRFVTQDKIHAQNEG